MKVLVIEDEPDLRELLQLSLRHFGGWDVVTAADGVEGLRLALAAKPDVVLLDMMMPGMDGMAVLAEMQRDAMLKALPVIFATAKVQTREMETYLAAGARGVIEKPFDPLTVCGRIEEILRQPA